MTKPDAPKPLSGMDLPSDGRAPGASVSSGELLGDEGVLRICHGPETYVLRRTRAGKLILTK